MSAKTSVIVSVVLGLIAVVLLQSEVRGGSVTVFRVTKDVNAGQVLRGAVVKVAMPKTAYAAVTSAVPTEEFEQWVQSTPVVRDVHAGDTVSFDMFLLTAGDGLKIDPGYRAVGLDIRKGSQSAGFLARPGDIVDVLATLPDAEGASAKTILQAKKVLAVDQMYRRDDSAFVRAHTYSTVTIEVTPEEAEMVEGYRNLVRDGFSLALRNPKDAATAQTSGFPVGRLR
jgi:Flp pilus assembly protein CpaB